jgi:hypothetical protein
VTVFAPTTKGIEALAEPEDTITPLTFSVAVESVTVGVMVTEGVAFETLTA